jgi:manganese-dependent inorganic pyrophosphatase
MKRKLWVIGHQNPDTDSICAALAYADFLRRTGQPDAEAACCGEVSRRTDFVLRTAGVEHPQLLMDVRPTAGLIARRDVVSARSDESLMAAFDRLRVRGFRSLPVLGVDGRLVGMLSLSKLLELLLPDPGAMERTREVASSLERIASVVSGQFLHAVETEREETLQITVAAFSAERFAERLRQQDAGRVLMVAGDRPSVQTTAIEYGVRCIVLTGGHQMEPALLSRARARGVSVLTSRWDTATTTMLIKCAKRVELAITPEFVSFPRTTTLRDVRATVAELAQTLFPVLDEQGDIAGVFSKSDLVNPPKQRLVLVDHNELAQAVRGASEADIVEVIDHHKLGGGLISREPIRFINEPVGSTCTIIARRFRDHGLDPGRSIALCLAGGIISDTLHLTSPTTTEVDRSVLAWLEPQCGMSLAEFAEGFFAAGSILQTAAESEAVRADCKEYAENGWTIAVAQIEEQSLDPFWAKKEQLRAALADLNRERGFDFACLLVTDITRHHSLLLAEGDARLLRAVDYPKLESGLFDLPGIVSRKKQLLPHLMWVMGRVVKTS